MKKTIALLALIIVALAILGFQTGAYLEFRNLVLGNISVSHSSSVHGGSGSNDNSSSNNEVETNTIINYGNSTAQWYNHTKSPSNWNFYNLTLSLTNGNVQGTYSSSYGEHQILGIKGLEQNATFYWSLWKFCPSYNAWDWSPVGVDNLRLVNNGTFGWYYQSQNGNALPPVQGAKVVVALDINTC